MLTPLQELAVERIQFFQEELKKRNKFVRLSFEQEFAIAHNGTPALDVLKADTEDLSKIAPKDRKVADFEKATAFLNSHGLHSLTVLEREAASHVGPLQIYEAKFDTKNPFEPSTTTPLEIALDTLKFKTKTVQELLAQTTYLSSDWAGKALTPVFAAVPFPEQDKNATIGLHANISVYDADGKNLFADELGNRTQLMHDVGNTLKELHREGGLAFIQQPEALARYGANESTPQHIGIGKNKRTCDTILDHTQITIFRKQSKNQDTNRYLEDRISGAAADPLIIAAMELAAVYDVVCGKDKPRTNFKHPIETKMGPWVERFEKSQHVKSLLGEGLYQGILHEYGACSPISSSH